MDGVNQCVWGYGKDVSGLCENRVPETWRTREAEVVGKRVV